MIQHTQINKHNIAHKLNHEEKSHNLNRFRKSLLQNSTSLMIKALKKLLIEESYLTNEGYI
jgi:hypothetical protein